MQAVRICGPNLSGPAQQKGNMHVHAEDCGDLMHYGPGRKFGGDMPGENEMSVEADSLYDITLNVYPPGEFNYDPDDESQVADFMNDLWFAPCVKLPTTAVETGELVHTVWECWVGDRKDSFVKLEEPTAVQTWLYEQIIDHLTHDHIHIVAHNSDEYTS